MFSCDPDPDSQAMLFSTRALVDFATGYFREALK
jgi:hypothetical protein